MHELLARYLFHWTPERAIWLGGQTLSWDARCAGIYAGFGVALLSQLACCRRRSTLPSWSLLALAAAFSLPMFLDVATTSYNLRPAQNGIKYLTGVWFGGSFCMVLYPTVAQFFGARPQAAPLSSKLFLQNIILGSTVSCLTLWNHLMSFYLLESLSWFGFIGLAFLMLAGLLVLFFRSHDP